MPAILCLPKVCRTTSLQAMLSNKRGQYAAWVTLKTVLLCDNIKDAKRLRDTLLRAGTLCFPSLAPHLSSIIGATTVPSASTIYRHRYFVDVAFMRYMRQKHTEEYKSSKHLRTCDAVLSELLNVGSFHYLMTDASPQGGQEWLLSQSRSIALSCLEAFGTHFVQLQATRNSCSQGSERQQQEIALQRQESSQFIQNNFEEHIFPVAGLGKAALSLRMKIYALLHQIKLEVESMEEFREFLSATVSITTDQGTEAGFAELPSLDLSPFQPPTDDISIECCDDEAGPLPIHVEFDDGEDLVHEGPARPGVQPAAEAAAPSRAGSNLPHLSQCLRGIVHTVAMLGQPGRATEASSLISAQPPCSTEVCGKVFAGKRRDEQILSSAAGRR